MKDILNLKMEIKGEYGNLKLVCEDLSTGNSVTFKQYFKNKAFANTINRWEPEEIVYNGEHRYIIKEYTKIYQMGNEITDDNLINELKQFVDDIVNTRMQLGFIGMLGLNEPKRI